MGKFNWVIARFVRRIRSHSGFLMFATLTSTVLIILPPSPQPHARFQWNCFLSCFYLQKKPVMLSVISTYFEMLSHSLRLHKSIQYSLNLNFFLHTWKVLFTFALNLNTSSATANFATKHTIYSLQLMFYFSVLFACPRAHDVNLWVLFSELLHSNDNIELRKKITQLAWPGLWCDEGRRQQDIRVRAFFSSLLCLCFSPSSR